MGPINKVTGSELLAHAVERVHGFNEGYKDQHERDGLQRTLEAIKAEVSNRMKLVIE